MKNSELIINFLLDKGFDTYFLVTGGAIAPIIDVVGCNKKCKYFCFQHEQSASMAAEGYYRTTGKCAVVLTTSGPGAQNIINGLCGAYFESVPILFITGQVSSFESVDNILSNPRQLGFQETDIIAMAKNFTKFCKKITNNDNILNVFKKGIEQMHNGRYGPSLIDIHVNIQMSDNNLENKPFPIIEKESHKLLNKTKINEIVKTILNSKRPLILVGRGVRLSNSIDLLEKLNSLLNLPIVTTWNATDIVNNKYTNYIGNIGVYGDRGANFAIQNCDLLLILGSRLDTRQTGGNLKLFSRQSKKIMIDIDIDEIEKFSDRGLKIDIFINNDLKIFLTGLIECIENFNFQKQSKTHHLNKLPYKITDTWEKKINLWKMYSYDKEYRSTDFENLNVYTFLKELFNNIPSDSVIIVETGATLSWVMQTWKPKSRQRLFSNLSNSSMGYGLPASIGAAIQNNYKNIYCIVGDGGVQMNIQELQTIYNYNLSIKIIVLNNYSYGMIKQFQDQYFKSRYIGTDSINKDYSCPDFIKIADAYKLHTLKIDKNNYIENIKKLINSDNSVLCNVILDPKNKIFPKLSYGNTLENMHPFLDEKIIKEHMIINPVDKIDNKNWVNMESR